MLSGMNLGSIRVGSSLYRSVPRGESLPVKLLSLNQPRQPQTTGLKLHRHSNTEAPTVTVKLK